MLSGWICTECQVTKNSNLSANSDKDRSLPDLYFSNKVAKFDAAKGTNRTNNCPEESVKFWMVSYHAKWLRFVLNINHKRNYS